MNPASSRREYRPAKQLHGNTCRNKGSSERRQKRLLCIVKLVSVIYIITGLLTTAMGAILIVFAFGEPQFTFSTGLPLMIGIMERRFDVDTNTSVSIYTERSLHSIKDFDNDDFLGAFILCCISMTGTRFRKYTSPQLCKWQCALLFFCHIGVLLLGSASLVLTFTFKHVKFSLLKDPTFRTIFPLGLGSAILVAVDLLGVLASLLFFCLLKPSFAPELHPRYNPSLQHNAQIEREVNYRLTVLRNLLTRYASDHVPLPQNPEVTSPQEPQKTHPVMDKKGYYVWEPV